MKSTFSFLLLLCFTFFSCKETKNNHFISDENYRNEVHQQFLNRKTLAERRSAALFSVFDKPGITLEEKEALEFLYAYMPLSDLADYDGNYFLGQVRAAFAARDYFSWGKTIPEDIFRHFVLVYRINNENMDTARIVFFNELKERVKNLSMKDAALEVNHWCHEKVTYRGTDSRTSAPLALVKTSWGRCGEESTFTTTALRAVGIPARQCYTPRWAHTDDNHAWVEVWIDGKWHYLGACEPEPELDVAWFTGPGKRAMMVHTNVFGKYYGPEEKNLETNLYSKINLLSNYADTRKVAVKVTDKEGKAIEGATVEFKVYNYAQYYPIAESVTSKEGTASILSGHGDLLVWAHKDNSYGYAKSSAKSQETTIVLDKIAGETYEEIYDLVPPAEQKIKTLDPEKIAQNAKRLAHEDSIRNAYMETFVKEENAIKFAEGLNINKEDVWKYLHASQGNWSEIMNFIKLNVNNSDLLPFLASLSEKDLRDTPENILTDHLKNTKKYGIKTDTPENLLAKNVLSPHIGLELIRPWRSFFQNLFDANDAKDLQNNISRIIKHIKEEITIKEDENYYNCPVSPQGVYELKTADRRSRDILFVAMCRSAGIAARLEPSTGRPQYYEQQWLDAEFETLDRDVKPQANLIFTNAKSNLVKPEYFTHFSLARFQDGDFISLNFRNDPALKTFPCKITVDTGYYRLITGSRANDGSVTIKNEYFNLKANQTKNMEIKMPEVAGKIQVLGIVDMNNKISLSDGSEVTLKDLSKGKGVVLCFADPDKEPTKHVLQELPSQSDDLNKWGGGVIFLVPDDKLSTAFNASAFKGLPEQTKWGVDKQRELLNKVTKTLQMDFTNNFPVTLFLNNNGGVLFQSEGYRIGIGENIIKTIRLQE